MKRERTTLVPAYNTHFETERLLYGEELVVISNRALNLKFQRRVGLA